MAMPLPLPPPPAKPPAHPAVPVPRSVLTLPLGKSTARTLWLFQSATYAVRLLSTASPTPTPAPEPPKPKLKRATPGGPSAKLAAPPSTSVPSVPLGRYRMRRAPPPPTPCSSSSAYGKGGAAFGGGMARARGLSMAPVPSGPSAVAATPLPAAVVTLPFPISLLTTLLKMSVTRKAPGQEGSGTRPEVKAAVLKRAEAGGPSLYPAQPQVPATPVTAPPALPPPLPRPRLSTQLMPLSIIKRPPLPLSARPAGLESRAEVPTAPERG